MKTTFKNLIYSMSICCIFFACNNDLGESSNQLNSSKETTISFIYDGELYTSQCLETEDTIIILDKSTQLIADKLSTLPRLTTIVSPDSEKPIMYFDTPEDADKYFNWTDVSNDIMTKSETTTLFVTLFEDNTYRGWTINKSIPFGSFVEEPGLGGKNEKISSLKIWHSLGYMDTDAVNQKVGAVKLFEDKNYEGSSIYFYVTVQHITNYVKNLKDYPLYPGSKRNWGDRTCSYKAGYKTLSELPNWK